MKTTTKISLALVFLLGLIEFAPTPGTSPLTRLSLISNAYADRDLDDVEIDDVARRSSRRGDRRGDRRDRRD